MSRAQCQRAWEAEAIENGQLDGLDRASFARHAVTCDVCAREQAALSRLRALVKRAPSVASTPLERRRLRVAVLARAHRETLDGHRDRRVAILAGLGLGFALLAGAFLWRRAFDRQTSAPSFEVLPIGTTDWHLDREGAQTELRLNDGVVALHVDKLVPTQRFVLLLPDGELEVRGTRFFAEVREGRTARVDVTEGTVVVRLAAEAPRTLTAGQGWHRDGPGGRESAAESGTSAPLVPSPVPEAPPRAAPERSRAPNAARSTPASAPKTADNSVSPSAGMCFARAMAAFDAGSYDRAEELFADFERRFPTDSRIEDADFLRVVIRMRGGDSSGAEQRAHAYLARHPKGLRHGEVEAFLRRVSANADRP
jgi:hypothetical protein